MKVSPVVKNSVLFLTGVLCLLSAALGQSRTPGSEGMVRVIPAIPPYKIQVPGTALEQPIDPKSYIIGPGDVFLVSIIGTEPYLVQATVTPTGKLVIPQVGTVTLVSLTVEEGTRKVLALIKKVYPMYEAECTLYGIREIKISVTGAVPKPAIYRTTPVSRVSDLLAQAGGWKPAGALHRIEITNGEGQPKTVDLTRFYYDGDMRHNPQLRNGDRVYVPFSDIEEEMVSVRGLGASPAYIAIRPGEQLSTFLGRWYDTRSKAEINMVELHRRGDSGETAVTIVSAESFATFPLQPGDVLYIRSVPGVEVVGEVKKPGKYPYQPGLTAYDYVAYAGGVTRDGSNAKMTISRVDGTHDDGARTVVRAGDIIYVKRSFNSVVLGQLGLVQAALTFLNIYLAYLATLQ